MQNCETKAKAAAFKAKSHDDASRAGQLEKKAGVVEARAKTFLAKAEAAENLATVQPAWQVQKRK